jgi:hypothetical protein
MPATVVFLLVVLGILVAALATYLVRTVVLLRRIVDTLGKITFGGAAIAHRTEPLGELLGDINARLEAIATALEGVASEIEARQVPKVS